MTGAKGLIKIASICLLLSTALLAFGAESPALEGATVLASKGRVELQRSGAQVWDPAQTNTVLHLHDQLRTLESSRATVRLRDATIVNFGELTTVRIDSEPDRSVVELLRGVLSFFHRDQPGDSEVRQGSASAIIRGTEFAATVDESNLFTVVVFQGQVDLTNQLGGITAKSGETVEAAPNRPPERSPSLSGTNRSAIQWTLYYPAVLDPADITLPDRWQPVLEFYKSGDLSHAIEAARTMGAGATDSERLFQAALRLSVGDVVGMRHLLTQITRDSHEAKLGSALEEVVRAVQFEPFAETTPAPSDTATEWLAASYRYQSQRHLDQALTAARNAVTKSPAFGFAQARVAELEFAHGNISAAHTALREALRLSPKLAPAVALEGFIFAAHGKYPEALASFDHAIALDAGLSDAWLGRGLVRFHQGERKGGRVDLETAAAIEPQRSVLRSYLGKAFAEEGSDTRALSELQLAESLDAQDPTALLYSALIRFQHYELAEAIRNLEESTSRNRNRSVFRSDMLLDQDAAVRSANLANIFDMADMADVARRESSRAVMFDYANYSAHLNLASSFNALRDPTRFNLRDETVWFNEHLLASLLAPTDAAPLSQNLSQNEYSRLFARNRVGFSSTTEYLGTGEFRQLASQFGNFQDFSYSLDLDADWKDGERPNQDLSRVEWYSRAKFSITPADSILLLVKYEDFDSGDNFQYADQSQARPTFRFQETQTPLLLAGFHHEWNPGSHTLFIGGRLENEQHFTDQSAPQLVGFSFPVSDPASGPFSLSYENRFVIYSGEINHILETGAHTTILGARFQKGSFDAAADLNDAPLGPGVAGLFGGNTHSIGDADFQRGSVYFYHTWEIIDNLRLTGGLSYDDISSPENFRQPPLEQGEKSTHGLSPKAALIYSPVSQVTLRGMYAQSVGGVSYDESVTLEPTQLAGFAQSFRTLISESLVGSVEVPRHEVAGLGIDLKFAAKTYLSAEGTFVTSAVDRRLGFFDFDSNLGAVPGVPSVTGESLRYEERGARLGISQVLGDEWFANATYDFTRAELDRELPSIPATAGFARTQNDRSDLHRLGLSILYQRSDGWFGRAAVTFLHQDNTSPNANPGVPGSENLAELNLFAGWRFPHLHGDITVGVLNLTGSGYRLNPLTPYEEYPRERTFYCRLRINL